MIAFRFIKVLLTQHNLILNLSKKDFKVRYKNALLGFLWMFLLPIFQMVVLSIVFSIYVKIETTVAYPLFLLAGLIPWNFLSLSLNSGTYSFIEQSNLIKKVHFPREIIPISIVMGHCINFLCAFALFFFVQLIILKSASLCLLFLPVLILAYIAFTALLTSITAIGNVFFRDIRYIVEACVMLWFYASPVFYPIERVPPNLQFLYKLNPMAAFLNCFRDCLFAGRFPSTFDLTYIGALLMALLIAASLLYHKKGRIIADYI